MKPWAVRECNLDGRTAAHAAGVAAGGVVGSHHFTTEQLGQAGADYAIASLREGLPL